MRTSIVVERQQNRLGSVRGGSRGGGRRVLAGGSERGNGGAREVLEDDGMWDVVVGGLAGDRDLAVVVGTVEELARRALGRRSLCCGGGSNGHGVGVGGGGYRGGSRIRSSGVGVDGVGVLASGRGHRRDGGGGGGGGGRTLEDHRVRDVVVGGLARVREANVVVGAVEELARFLDARGAEVVCGERLHRRHHRRCMGGGEKERVREGGARCNENRGRRAEGGGGAAAVGGAME